MIYIYKKNLQKALTCKRNSNSNAQDAMTSQASLLDPTGCQQ